MTLRKFLIGFVVLLVMQAGVFAWSYRDLLYLRQPKSVIVTDGTPAFIEQASEALTRKHLTRQHLDTIADTANTLGQPAYEIAALERRLQQDPHEGVIRLRLAEAYRRTGRLDRAEALYLEVLQRQEQTR